METIIETLKLVNSKIKTVRIKRVGQEQIKYGLLDSGATHNVRAIRSDEDYESLVPIEAQVAFDSEVKTELFMNREGTIIGPKGTETIVSTHEVVRAGYVVDWKKGQLVVSKKDVVLPVEIRSGTPVLPNDICLDLIEEVKLAKKLRIKHLSVEEDFRIDSVWPQLTKCYSGINSRMR